MITSWNTDRLSASRIASQYFDDVCRLHSDPMVMRTLSADGEPLCDEKTIESIADAEMHWEKHGFGFWVFHSRSDGQFVGRGGLKKYTLKDLGGQQEVGLAYAVTSPLWNRGFATEMARGILDIGFTVFDFPNIASWTLPQNKASQRVMEKLGFRYERDFCFAGLPHRFYNLKADSNPQD